MSLTPNASVLAAKLIVEGFTVYIDKSPSSPRGDSWFHFSREVGETTCYGTVSVDGMHNGIEWLMPVMPTPTYGSSIIIKTAIDEHDDVKMAFEIARPLNYGRYTERTHVNALPWGIGRGQYVPAQIQIVPA